MVTLRDIQYKYPGERVSQIGSKQMFIIHKGNPLLLSYRAVIGICLEGVWYISDYTHSPTTNKQIEQFMFDRTANRTCKRTSQTELETLLKQ
jgi:hypothetical protein